VYSVSLCRSVDCLCANVYCTTATACVNPTAVNKNISYHIIHYIYSSHELQNVMARWKHCGTVCRKIFRCSLFPIICNYIRIIYSLLNIKFERLLLKCINLIKLYEVPMGRT